MFKKIALLFISASMIFCLSACNNEEVSSNQSKNQSSTTLSSEESKAQGSVEESPIQAPITEKENDDISSSAPTTSSIPSETSVNQPTVNYPTKPTHTHSYSAATCTSPKKCSCGATTGAALGHSFSNATCTNPKICNRCGAKSGSALGHSYSVATCFAPKTCSRCKKTEGTVLQHNYLNGKCSMCNKTDPDWQISLYDLKPFDVSDSNDVQTANNLYDSYGNYYSKCVHMAASSYGRTEDAEVTYHLGGKYNNFTGTIAYENYYLDKDWHIDGRMIINIYADDKLVYSKQNITKWTEPFNFDITIANCKFLKIHVINKNPDGCYLIIANAELKK